VCACLCVVHWGNSWLIKQEQCKENLKGSHTNCNVERASRDTPTRLLLQYSLHVTLCACAQVSYAPLSCLSRSFNFFNTSKMLRCSSSLDLDAIAAGIPLAEELLATDFVGEGGSMLCVASLLRRKSHPSCGEEQAAGFTKIFEGQWAQACHQGVCKSIRYKCAEQDPPPSPLQASEQQIRLAEDVHWKYSRNIQYAEIYIKIFYTYYFQALQEVSHGSWYGSQGCLGRLIWCYQMF